MVRYSLVNQIHCVWRYRDDTLSSMQVIGRLLALVSLLCTRVIGLLLEDGI